MGTKRLGNALVRCFVLLCAGLLGSCGSDSSLLDTIEKRGSIIIAVDEDFPPLSQRDAQGNWSGFDVDVAREIAERLGVTATFVAAPWDSVIAGNWRGQWDVHVGSAALTPERSGALHFVRPAYRYDTAYFFTRATEGVDYEEINATTKICASGDTTYSAWLQGSLDLGSGEILVQPPAERQLQLEVASCVSSVVEGSSDMMVTSYAEAIDAIESGDLVATGPRLFVEELFVTVDRSHSESSEALRARIGAALEEMHGDGTLSTLSVAVFGVDLTVTE